ncbi:MAG: hypothetical protein EPN30_03750 [Actinomycetota bacterium]|nr:MAG: hypothetical protein EPN30_03750 [Actinomycetota bacterium]
MLSSSLDAIDGARACILDVAEVTAGENVLILCEQSIRVEPEAIDLLAIVAKEAGASVQVLWTDQLRHSWWEDVPRIALSAFQSADVVIHCHYTIGRPHRPISDAIASGVRFVRNYATDMRTLSSDWARFPMGLYDVIEEQITNRLEKAENFRVVTPNGSDVQGRMARRVALPYFQAEARTMSKSLHRVFPPGVFMPINVIDANGIYMVDNVISWGARIWGLPEISFTPTKLTIENGRVVHVEGEWADQFRHAFDYVATKAKVGDDAWLIDSFHSGLHPRAMTPIHPQIDPDLYWHNMHHHPQFFHFHIGGDMLRDYGTPYMTHISSGAMNATLYVDGEPLYIDGKLAILADAELRAIAENFGDPNELFLQRPVWT